jgi:hypothetical protein
MTEMNSGGLRPRNDPTYPIIDPDGNETEATYLNGRDLTNFVGWRWRDEAAVLAAHREHAMRKARAHGLRMSGDGELSPEDDPIAVAEELS